MITCVRACTDISTHVTKHARSPTRTCINAHTCVRSDADSFKGRVRPIL